MNYIYLGRSSDLNVGNGKTASAVGEVINQWVEHPEKQIYSNIKLKDVDYKQFSPENIDEVLETDNCLILLDELHAIVHKNHSIQERCKFHGEHTGLCYRLAQFFRQIRKRNNDSYSTCQTFGDAQAQYRQLMQRQIVCEKMRLDGDRLRKCDEDKCPSDHRHYIKQKLYQNFVFVKELPLFDPEPYYSLYDSFEIVKGWVNYEK
ncbi:MAG: hypothetical protein PHE73_09045 [Sulfurovaceae bacterium]|nr:hypothetical protein [Sulfurovaceae bacterium]